MIVNVDIDEYSINVYLHRDYHLIYQFQHYVKSSWVPLEYDEHRFDEEQRMESEAEHDCQKWVDSQMLHGTHGWAVQQYTPDQPHQTM